MDYLISINGHPVFNMTHGEMAREIKNSGATLHLECERGDHIVPSFDELFPGLRGDDDPDSTKRKCPGNMMQYYKDAMEHHGLGHMPQPDNFTTIGNNLGIEINQYNCPIDAYSQDAVAEMRDVMEKGGMTPLPPEDHLKPQQHTSSTQARAMPSSPSTWRREVNPRDLNQEDAESDH